MIESKEPNQNTYGTEFYLHTYVDMNEYDDLIRQISIWIKESCPGMSIQTTYFKYGDFVGELGQYCYNVTWSFMSEEDRLAFRLKWI